MFHSARIKLTAWYLFIIMLVSISFSIVIYKGLMSEVERFAQSQRFRIERQLRNELVFPQDTHRQNTILPPITDPDLVADTKRRLLCILVVINGSILLLSGGLGYFLAGKTLKPIQEMLLEQNQFITDASHELRTPLTSIKSSVEVHLRDKHMTIARARKLLMENIKDVNKLQRLSDQLLELAQYQKPNGKDIMNKISLRDGIKNALRSVEALRSARSIRIQNTTKDGAILGNINEITDLFAILIDNAIKYSKEKSTITLTSSVKNGWIHVSVADVGVGIGKNDIPHIFDRFYRADSARSKTTLGGYGLGLSIAKKIVDRHTGSITCESTLGKGSVFTVRFPIVS
jgi:signal transduction histidine kinase